MTDNEQISADDQGGSQSSYQETPYADASWEIVGELRDELEFIPMDLDVVSDDGLQIDPMFGDYGGLQGKGKTKRWHLPEDLAGQYEESGSAALEEEEIQDDRISMTEEELTAIKQEAFQAGKLQALEEGASESNARLAAVEQSVQTVVADFTDQVMRSVEETQSEAVRLAIAISKKIIDTAVEINPEYILPIIQQALDLSGTSLVQKVRVSPQDLEFIQLVGIEKHLSTSTTDWTFEADPSIKAGCVVETTSGEIDFDLDAAWERIQDNVVKVLR